MTALNFTDAEFSPRGGFLTRGLRPASRVIIEVSKASGVTVGEIKGPGRSVRISRARFAAMAICRDYIGLSFPQIGRIFERDHTTVINALRRVDALVADTDLDDFEEIARRAGLVEGE